jgi:hypothetical protein
VINVNARSSLLLSQSLDYLIHTFTKKRFGFYVNEESGFMRQEGRN